MSDDLGPYEYFDVDRQRTVSPEFAAAARHLGVALPPAVLPATVESMARNESRLEVGSDEPEIHERRPFIIIEVQPRPPVPPRFLPYWWGNYDLTFRDPDTRQPVWEGQVPHAALGPTRVEVRDGAGWVIVTTVDYGRTDRNLRLLGVPRTIEGSPQSRWTFWG